MMMREIAKVAFAEPFRPFRFHLADGMTLEVCNSVTCFVGKRKTTLYTCLSDDQNLANRHEVALLNDQISSIEYLD